MNAVIEKTDDQIAKDKAAVEAMRNAKSNMDTALKRIDLLEATLRTVQARCEVIGKAFSAEIYLSTYNYDTSNYTPKKVKGLFGEIDNLIKGSL